MENQINMGGQNTQEMEQNQINQSVQLPGKSKINYWVIPIIVVVLLLIGVSSFLFILKSHGNKPPAVNPTIPEESQQSNAIIDKIYIHKAGNTSQLLDQTSPNYQKIKNITSKLITSTLNLPIERREKIKLMVAINQEGLPVGSDQSNYLEIQSEPMIRDNIEDMGYDRILFILSGQSHLGIFGHNIVYKGKPNPNSSWWPWWGPYDVNLFWKLGEFLGVPTPTPQFLDHSARQSQDISINATQTENQAVILAEFQRLGIDVKDRWEQSEIKIPPDLSDANWGLKKNICEEGGYNLTAYAGKSLLSTSYLTNEIWNDKESLLVWILTEGDRTACVYKSVLPGSNLIPGIFSVKEDPNIKKR